MYNSNHGSFYSPKGDLIANTWSEFINLQNVDEAMFGINSEWSNPQIWIGSQSNNCSDWNSDSTAFLGTESDIYEEVGVGSWVGQNKPCNEWKYLLCSCE